MRLNIFLFAICAFLGKTAGQLRCYACGFSSIDSDRSCLEINNSTVSVECTYTYCTIMRQEFTDPAGEVVSFVRGCEEAPIYLNHEVQDSTFKTYFRACTSDLCNIGNGIQSVVGGNLSPYPDNTGANLLVPGTGAAATARVSWLIMGFTTFIILNAILM